MTKNKTSVGSVVYSLDFIPELGGRPSLSTETPLRVMQRTPGRRNEPARLMTVRVDNGPGVYWLYDNAVRGEGE